MQIVIVTAGKKWANKEPHTFALAKQAPADLRELRFPRDEYLLLDASAVLEFENPAWPRLGGELLDALCAIAADDIGRVILRGQFKSASRGFYPGIESIHQRKSPGRRRGGGEQQRMVTARS